MLNGNNLVENLQLLFNRSGTILLVHKDILFQKLASFFSNIIYHSHCSVHTSDSAVLQPSPPSQCFPRAIPLDQLAPPLLASSFFRAMPSTPTPPASSIRRAAIVCIVCLLACNVECQEEPAGAVTSSKLQIQVSPEERVVVIVCVASWLTGVHR